MSLTVEEVDAVLRLRDELSSKLNGIKKNLGGFSGAVDTAIGTFTGFLGAQAVIGGITAAFSFAKDAAFGMNATLESTTLQFSTLMGDSDAAKAHVQSLFEFAKATPFETGPIIEASRMMQTFGGAALNTKANLTLLGNAAAATGAPIDQLGFWTGRMFAMLQAGKPFGEAAMRLQELAVLSPKTRDEMEKLQKSGGSAAAVFQVFQADMGKFSGAMEKQAGTWSGVTSTMSDTIKILVSGAMMPLFEMIRNVIGQFNEWIGTDTFAQKAESLAIAIRDGIAGAIIFAKGHFDTILAIGAVLKKGWDDLVGLGGQLADAFSFVSISSSDLGSAWSSLMTFAKGVWDLVVVLVSAFIALGDKLGIFKGITGVVVTVLAGFFDVLGRVGTGLGWVADKIRWLLNAVGLLDKDIKPMQVGFDSLAKTSLPATAIGLTETTTSAKNTTAAFTPLIRATDDETKAIRKAAKEAASAAADRRYENQLSEIAMRADYASLQLEGYLGALRQVSQVMSDDIQAPTAMFFDQAGMNTRTIAGARAAQDAWLTVMRETGQQTAEAIMPPPAVIANLWGQIGSTLKGSLGGLNNIFQSAFEGGGGIGGAVKSLATNMVSGLTSMIPIVGPIISQFSGAIVAGFSKIGSALSGLFGGDAKKANKIRDKFIDAAGGMEALQEQAREAGISLDTFLNSKRSKDVERAIADINTQLDAYKEKQKNANEFLSKFDELLGLVASSGRLASAAFLDMLKKFTDAGGTTKALAAFIADQMTRVAAGLQAFLDNAVVATQAGADALAESVFAAFNQFIASGMSVAEAIKKLEPVIQKLEEQMTKAGFTGSDAFKSIQAMAKLMEDKIAGPAITAINGLGDALVGLHNVGLLNQKTFVGLTNQITQTFQSLIAQGYDGRTALALIGPTLQTIWELQKDFGYEIDAATQALLDQAVAAGLVGDAHRSADERIIALLKEIRDIFKDWRDIMGTTIAPIETIADAVDDISLAAEGIPDNPFANWVPPDVEPPPVDDGLSAASGRGGGGQSFSALWDMIRAWQESNGGDLDWHRIPSALGIDPTTLHAMGVPGYAEGGVIRKTGLALVHAGEVVTPAEGSALPTAFGGSQSNVHDDELHQEIRRLSLRLEQREREFPLRLAIVLKDAMAQAPRR